MTTKCGSLPPDLNQSALGKLFKLSDTTVFCGGMTWVPVLLSKESRGVIKDWLSNTLTRATGAPRLALTIEKLDGLIAMGTVLSHLTMCADA